MKFVRILLASLFVMVSGLTIVNANAPSFDKNFANYLTDETPDEYGRVETVFDICIDRNVPLMENVKRLFYPHGYTYPDSGCGTSSGGIIWNVMRVVGFAVLVFFFVMAGIKFMIEIREENEIKKAGKSLVYIAYGAFMFFGVTWILGTVLNLENVQGSKEIFDAVHNTLFLQILSFFKATAFFLAIIMMVYYGFRVMMAMDQEDKIKTARRGVMNVVIALVLIKIVDYVYFIAQSPQFADKGADFIVQVAIILGYVIGALFMVSIFYAGFMMLTGTGNEESLQKAKNTIMTIFLSSIVIFLFLLIVYQVFNEFA